MYRFLDTYTYKTTQCIDLGKSENKTLNLVFCTVYDTVS
jgi:hypothetical protein